MGTIRLIVETRPPKDAEGLAAFKKMVGQLTKLLSVRHAEIWRMVVSVAIRAPDALPRTPRNHKSELASPASQEQVC